MRAFCHFGKWHDIEVEDDVTAYLEYDNGATGVFITTTGEYPGVNRLEISGTKGRVSVDNDKLTYLKCVDTREFLTAGSGFGSPSFENVAIEINEENPLHAGVCRNFTNAILGKEPLLTTVDEALNSVELMNAMHLSTWLDKTITLPVDGDNYYSELKKRIKTSRRKTNVVDTVLDTSGTY